MSVPAQCSRKTRDRLLRVKENGRVFSLTNVTQIEVEFVRVDDCAIKSGVRCDYLFRYSGREVYVELKGADIRKAVEQIGASVSQLSVVEKDLRAAVIVSSRVPREDTSTMLAKRRILRDLVSSLKVKNDSLEMSV